MALVFDHFILDTNAAELRRDGEPVAIEPQVFELIAFLAANAGRVVSKDEILSAVWRGRIVSDSAISTRIASARHVLGDDGTNQKFIKTIHGRGFRFDVRPRFSGQNKAIQSETNAAADLELPSLADQSPVQYFESYDGASIAHCSVGNGYPVVFSGSWMSHLEQDWDNPGWGPYVRHLAAHFELIRYDLRGNGMSAWDNIDIAFDKMVDDLELTIDTYGCEKVAIFGGSQGAAVAIAYAARHPNRVARLVLYGGYPRGRKRRGDPESTAESEALVTLIRQSWARDNPAIRQQVTAMFMPHATQDEFRWFNEFQRACAPADNVAQFRQVFDEIDVSTLLDQISQPTLIVHATGDVVAPLSEAKLMASRIKNSQLIILNSDSHMIFENDPEFPKFLGSIVDFLKTEQVPDRTALTR